MLARSDEFDVVKKVQELGMEYLALTPELMITGLNSTIGLSNPKVEWGDVEAMQIDRMSTSLSSCLLSLRKKFHVRYLARSEPCFRVADGVNVPSLSLRPSSSENKRYRLVCSTPPVPPRCSSPSGRKTQSLLWSSTGAISAC